MPTPPILLPLWARPGVTETLEWLTDVTVFEDGSEDRVELRDAPRQAFQMEFFVAPGWEPRIKNIIYGGRQFQWLVPVWPQAQRIGAVAAGLTTLPAETRYSEFRENSNALIFESPTSYQIVEVSAVASDSALDLAEATTAFDDAWLVPVRLGFLTSDPTRRFNGRQSSVQMSFRIEDNVELAVAAPAQYLGADLYTDPGLLDGGVQQEEMTARIYLHDERLGPVSYSAPWLRNRPARTHRMMAENAAEAWAMRQFLHRRVGRSREFWQPSFERDMRLNQTASITTSLNIHPDDFLEFAADRNHIAIETAAGWLCRQINSITDLGDRLQLGLDATIGGVAPANVKRVCFLGRKRLDTDRVQINWVGGTVSTCAVTTLEIAP